MSVTPFGHALPTTSDLQSRTLYRVFSRSERPGSRFAYICMHAGNVGLGVWNRDVREPGFNLCELMRLRVCLPPRKSSTNNRPGRPCSFINGVRQEGAPGTFPNGTGSSHAGGREWEGVSSQSNPQVASSFCSSVFFFSFPLSRVLYSSGRGRFLLHVPYSVYCTPHPSRLRLHSLV